MTKTKIKTLVAILVGALLLIGLLFVIPTRAQASDGGRALMPTTIKKAAKVAATNYGSGFSGGPTSAPARTGDPATADILLVGDSIGNRSTPAIRAALLVKDKTLATITQSGQNTQGLADLLLAEASVPPIVIMEAGTNDVYSPPAIKAQIDRVKAWAVSKGVELFWVDTYVGRSTYLVHDIRNSGWVNSFIYAAIPYDHIIQWQTALSAAVGRGKPMGYYLDGGEPGGGVHPRMPVTGYPNGVAFFAAVVAEGF
jgi:hypothetical protein